MSETKEAAAEPAPRLKPDITKAPEFAAAVSAAVADLVPGIVEQVKAGLAIAGAPAQSETDIAALARILAVQLGEISGQGVGKVYIDPEVIETRRQAGDDMVRTVIDYWTKAQAWAEENGDSGDNPFVPVYKLIAKTQIPMGELGEVLVDPVYRGNDRMLYPQMVDWPGIPNMAMRPENEPAREIFALFQKSIGDRKVLIRAKDGTILGAPGADTREDPLAEMTRKGTAVRGKGLAFVRNQMEAPELGSPGDSGGPQATLRRRDTNPREKKRIWGTTAPAVEVS